MLEDLQSRISGRSRTDGYSERQEERSAIGVKLGLAALEKKMAEVQSKIDTEVERRDEKFDADKRKQLKDLALAIALVWSCDTSSEAKEIVEKLIGAM